MVKDTVQVFRSGLMELNTKVNGEIIRQTGKESSGMLTVTSMREIGKMIRLMALVFILM